MRSVLMVLPYANVGGTERHVLLLSRGLREQGIQVRIALPDGPIVEEFRAEGFSLRMLPTPSLGTMPALLKALREEASAGLDVLHVHAAMEFVWGAKWVASAVPRVFTAHGYHVEPDYMKAGLMLNRTAHAVLAVSDPDRARLLRYGLNPGLTHLVPNGIDLESLAGPPGTLKAELQLPEGSRLLAMVNRLDAFKRVDLVVRALPRLRERSPDVCVAVVGEGPERPRLEALAGDLGVSQAIRWLGRRNDLGNILRSADAFVMPTAKEAFGMALLEAMACGLPVVATDLPALRGLMQPGVEGEFVSLDADEKAWAETLGSLLMDGPRMARYAEAGRARAGEYSHRRMAAETLVVYRRLLAPLTTPQVP